MPLTIEDIRLDEDEIISAENIWFETPHFRDEEFGDYYHDVKKSIANTATDKAIRKVIELLEKWYRTGEHLMSDETIKALKKLVEGEQGGN